MFLDKIKLQVLLFIYLLLPFINISQQEKAIKQYSSITKKGTTHYSMNLLPGLAYSEVNYNLAILAGFNPQFHYFVVKKTSLGVGYIGFINWFSKTPQHNRYYNNVELIANYYFKDTRKFVINLTAKYNVADYKPYTDTSYTQKKDLGHQFFVGGSMLFRIKHFDRLAINISGGLYFNLNQPKEDYRPVSSYYSGGINYFINAKK